MSNFNDDIAFKNIPDGSRNRGYDNKIEETDPPAISVTLEKINSILIDYLQNTIKPSITVLDELHPVQILYGAGERWAQIRKEGVLRDQQGKLQTPVIMLRRTNIKNSMPSNPNNKYLYMSLENRWNPRNAYDQFAVKNNINPSRSMRQVIIPDYVKLEYDVFLWTEYQAQMDELIQQIHVENFEYWGNRNNYKFRVDIQEYQIENELPPTQDRIVRTAFKMNVEGYLLPERMVRDGKLSATDIKSYTAKKIVIMSEAVKDVNNPEK